MMLSLPVSFMARVNLVTSSMSTLLFRLCPNYTHSSG